jgi:hypothetical protein
MGAENVWDFPRPPAVTSHPPTVYVPPEDARVVTAAP